MMPMLLLVLCLDSTDGGACEIRRLTNDFIAAYNAGDVRRLMTVYADDFVDMSKGEATATGAAFRRDTAERMADTFAKFIPHLEVVMEEMATYGGWGFTRGHLKVTLTPRRGDAPTIVERRFLEIWRRQKDGSWKVARSMDNAAKGPPSTLDFRR